MNIVCEIKGPHSKAWDEAENEMSQEQKYKWRRYVMGELEPLYNPNIEDYGL